MKKRKMFIDKRFLTLKEFVCRNPHEVNAWIEMGEFFLESPFSYDKAGRCFELAESLWDGSSGRFYERVGKAYDLRGNSDRAVEFYEKAVKKDPNLHEVQQRLSQIFLPGPGYLEILQFLHDYLKPKTYVEIGVQSGKSLALSKSISVGVDPVLDKSLAVPLGVKLFETTSDEFFVNHDVRQELGGVPIDFSFIDGLHLFDQVLKDFANLEANSRVESVICIHDCLPLSEIVSLRERKTRFWVGDVWKTILVLKRYRPDLEIFTIPTSPSGLALITNLDPSSTLLMDRHREICSEYLSQPWIEDKESRYSALSTIANSFESILAAIG